MKPSRKTLLALMLAALLFLPGARHRKEHVHYVYVPVVQQTELPPILKGVGIHEPYFDPAQLPRVRASWYFTWYDHPPLAAGAEAVPMIKEARYAGSPTSGSSSWLMWFNEPDVPNQANLSPAEAAALYNAHHDDAVYAGKKHLSPSVFFVSWLADWLPLLDGDKLPDGLGVHCYYWDSGARPVDPEDPTRTVVDAALDHCRGKLAEVDALAKQWGIGEVWLTEYALVGAPPADQGEFLARMITDVAPDFPRLTRVAAFIATCDGTETWAFGAGNRNTSLVNRPPDGRSNAAG